METYELVCYALAPELSPERIAATVATLDAHLAHEAPFLRRLYARDLEQLTQLRRLPGMTLTDERLARPSSERPGTQPDTDQKPLPVIPVEPSGFCPIWRRPALLCPA